MMTNQQRDADFDVMFSGRELLCVPGVELLVIPPPLRPDRTFAPRRAACSLEADRASILACFTEDKPYSRGELRFRTLLAIDRFDVAIRRLRQDGVLRRIGYGLWRKG